MLSSPNHPSVVTTQSQAHPVHGVRTKQPRGEVIKFDRELSSNESRMLMTYIRSLKKCIILILLTALGIVQLSAVLLIH